MVGLVSDFALSLSSRALTFLIILCFLSISFGVLVWEVSALSHPTPDSSSLTVLVTLWEAWTRAQQGKGRGCTKQK